MKETGLTYRELVYNGTGTHDFIGVVLKIGGYTHNGRRLFVKDNHTDLEIEVILWDSFDVYMRSNEELKVPFKNHRIMKK